MTWEPPWILLAEETHLLLSLVFVFGAEALYHAPVWGAVTVLVLGTVKEFTWDLKVEGATGRNGVKDLSFYLLGVGLALLLVRVFG